MENKNRKISISTFLLILAIIVIIIMSIYIYTDKTNLNKEVSNTEITSEIDTKSNISKDSNIINDSDSYTDKTHLNEEKSNTEITTETNTKSNISKDSNIIITQNGEIISNSIPNELSGKYINKNDADSYIELTNDRIVVSELNGSDGATVYKNGQIKLYINYLNTDIDGNQYVTIEFYIPNNGYNQNITYTYIGEKSSNDNQYHFKSVNPNSAGGEGDNNDYPYSKNN